MSDFFNRLDLLRQSKGESIIDIAHYLGISGPAVHGWKKGGLPKPDKLRLLAEHYGVTVEWLLTGIENTVGHRPAKAYDQRMPDVVSEHKICDKKDIEIEQLRSELREARAVIRDLAAALASKPSPAAARACGAPEVSRHKERKDA